MHEISLIHGLIEMVKESAADHGISHVDHVRLVIGEWHGALSQALNFAFKVLTRDTICEGAVLEIEKRSIRYCCQSCSKEFMVLQWPYVICPFCGAQIAELKQGKELYVDYYEGE